MNLAKTIDRGKEQKEKPKDFLHRCKIKDLERKKFFHGELKVETFLKMKCQKKLKQLNHSKITSEFNLRCYPSKCGNS